MAKVAPYVPPNRDQGKFFRKNVTLGSILTRCATSGLVTGSGSGTGWSVTMDSTMPAMGNKSVKMQPAALNADYVQAQVVMDTPLLMNTEAPVSFLFYVENPLMVQSITILFYMSGQGGYMEGTIRLSEHVRNQWGWYSVARSNFAPVGTATTANWNYNVTRIIYKIQYATDAAPPVWCGGVVYNAKDRPKLVLGFDGSYASQYSVVLPKLQSVGVTATLYTDTLYLGSSATYITEDNLDEMYAAGLEVAWHAYTLYGGLDDTAVYTGQATIEAQFNGFWDWCSRRGYVRGIGHICYPISNPNKNASLTIRDYVIAAMRNTGVKTARLGFDASSNKQLQPTALGVLESYALSIRALVTTTTLATAKTWIDDAISRGETIFIYGHQFMDSPPAGNYWVSQDFRDLIDYAVTKRDAGLLDITGRVSDWWLSVGGS